MISSNREFTKMVDGGTYPNQVEVPLDSPFRNMVGEIQNLALEKFSSAAIIRSREGTVRANHYHRTDWHYAYVVDGHVSYYWRPVGSKEAPKVDEFKSGKMFFTPPLVEHAMFFHEPTTLITLAKNIRDTEHHEEDVVRVKLIEVHATLTNEGRLWKYVPSVVG